MMRSVPNSCTRPTRVLKGCPASATSSPMRKTRGSRRMSSAMASLTASPYVSSRSLMRVSSSTLFDDAIGPDQDRRRDAQADAARDALVDRQRDPALLLDRHQARVGALEDLVHELRQALEAVEHARLVADEATRVGEFLPPVHRGDTLAVRELRDLLTPDQRQGIREHEHGPGAARAEHLASRAVMSA